MRQETDILAVHECISADRNLRVRLSYHGLVIPLPQWFRYEHNWTLTKFSMLENFVSYLRNKGAVLIELSKLSEHSKCSKCQLKLVATESGIEHNDYHAVHLSRGGTPNIALRNFISQTFRIIDFHQQ